MKVALHARAARIARPLDWSPFPEREPFFCPRCWADFMRDEIDSATLLQTIEHPLRWWTAWVCPICTAPDFWDDDPSTEAQRHAALYEEIDPRDDF